jgi:hypothetical protein
MLIIPLWLFIIFIICTIVVGILIFLGALFLLDEILKERKLKKFKKNYGWKK